MGAADRPATRLVSTRHIESEGEPIFHRIVVEPVYTPQRGLRLISVLRVTGRMGERVRFQRK
jgi:hypothetical protein